MFGFGPRPEEWTGELLTEDQLSEIRGYSVPILPSVLDQRDVPELRRDLRALLAELERVRTK